MTKKLLILALLSLLAFTSPQPVALADAQYYQDDTPYMTYTVDYEGTLTSTLTAYRPVGSFTAPGAVNAPSDITVFDGLIYVADSGKSRVAVFGPDGVLVRSIGADELENPTGIGISPDGLLYVADKTLQAVFQFALDGTLLKTFERPDEPLYGLSNPFVPVKVAAGAGENIYVIGEGSTSGVIQLAFDGAFLGYFGVNLSSKPFIQRIADLFVQEGEYAGTAPPSPTNITISNQSLVYTSTPATISALKKLDINGNNILTTINYNIEKNIVDLAVSDTGYVYAIYDDGLVVEYDPSGNLLFAFNVLLSSAEVAGLVRVPTGIAIDEDGYLLISDRQMNRVLLFEPTAFTRLVHEAVDQYNNGSYEDSKTLFEAIVKQNANFALAHSALGKAYFYEGNTEAALQEYLLANDKAGYSDAYWEIRDQWMKANLGNVFTLLLVLFGLTTILKAVDKRTLVFAGVHKTIATWKSNPVVRRYTLLFEMLKHPIDASYQIKREHRATIGSASVILGFLFLEYLLLQAATGYLFNPFGDTVNLVSEAAVFFGVILLFVVANYLVATLADGEGWLKDIYIGTVYSLAPLVLFLIPYIALTNVMTQNEQIIISLAQTILIGWSVILVFISVKEIHNYEISQTFKNFLVTIFTMLIVVLIGFILYVFGSQLMEFVVAWLKEVVNRVFG
jgi:tetratricopeptide (TPR) repeat protein